MNKMRLDQEMVLRGLVPTRSQAESYIKLGDVQVDGNVVSKPGHFVSQASKIKLTANEQYVSRAALKLSSVADSLGLDFKNKVLLDVGSSTGGFTDYALRHGAEKVIAVEAGKDQLHPNLRGLPKIELHEQTDIRSLRLQDEELRTENEDTVSYSPFVILHSVPDIVVIDVSFISLREILPSVARLSGKGTQIVAMVKPQFEASVSKLKHKGVKKNDRMRRDILKDFESWVPQYFVIVDKADSQITGAKGNQERFYKLRLL